MKLAVPKIAITYLNDANTPEKIEITPSGNLHEYLTNLDKHKFIFFKELGTTINTSRILKVENTVEDPRRFEIVEKDGKAVAVEK